MCLSQGLTCNQPFERQHVPTIGLEQWKRIYQVFMTKETFLWLLHVARFPHSPQIISYYISSISRLNSTDPEISNAKNLHPYNLVTQKIKPQHRSALFYNSLKSWKFPGDETSYRFISSHFLLLIIQSNVFQCDCTKNHQLLFYFFFFLCKLYARLGAWTHNSEIKSRMLGVCEQCATLDLRVVNSSPTLSVEIRCTKSFFFF